MQPREPIYYDDTAPSKRLAEYVEHLTPGTALDVGIGKGKNALWLAEQGWQVEGIDPIPSELQVVRERAAQKGVHIALFEEDIFSFQPQKTYDLVVCAMVIHFLEGTEVKKAIEKLKSLVAPGGRIYLSVFSDKNTVKRPTMFQRGELDAYFQGWTIEKSFELKTPPMIMPNDLTPTEFWFEYLLAQKI